jgi:hypothetical protein
MLDKKDCFFFLFILIVGLYLLCQHEKNPDQIFVIITRCLKAFWVTSNWDIFGGFIIRTDLLNPKIPPIGNIINLTNIYKRMKVIGVIMTESHSFILIVKIDWSQ